MPIISLVEEEKKEACTRAQHVRTVATSQAPLVVPLLLLFQLLAAMLIPSVVIPGKTMP